MNFVSEEVSSTTIKKIKPKQSQTTHENMLIISKPTLTSEPNITPKTMEKEIITTEEKSNNLLFYIVFGLLVVSLLIIFTLLFVVYSNRSRKRY
jgi:hypothetical protein